MLKRTSSIHSKLQGMLLITVLSLLSLTIIADIYHRQQNLLEQAQLDLESLSQIVADNLINTLVFNKPDAAREQLNGLGKRQDIIAVRLYDGRNRLFAEFKQPAMRSNASAEDSWRGFFPQQLSHTQALVYQQHAIGHLELMADMSRYRVQLQEAVLLAVVIIFFSIFVIIIISRRLQQQLTDPVERLLTAIKTIENHRRFDLYVKKDADDELGQLVDAFNSMLDMMNDYDHQLSAYQRELEHKVRQRTAQLEEAMLSAEAGNRAKSNFLAMMSHEIRTPMNGVVGFIGLLRKTSLDAKQMEQVDNIATSAELLLSIINDVLDFSRMESGKLELDKEDFLLEKMLREIQQFFQPQINQDKLAFNLSIDSDVPFNLHGDQGRIKQILNNLISNAIKFTEQGEVNVDVSAEPIDAQHYFLNISVKDTGIGIAKEFLPKLFRSFEQGDNSVTRLYGGSGLGLVIAQNLAQLMDGTITVQSQLGIGSEFKVSIVLEKALQPMKLESLERMQGQETDFTMSAACLRGVRALLVDDDSINLTLGTALLQQVGVRVVSTLSAVEALTLLQEQAFDVVLLDLEMPELSGFEISRELRNSSCFSTNVPVIALTAHAFPEKRQEAIEAGMSDLLAKPYRQESLYRLLMQWCCDDMSASSVQSVTDLDALALDKLKDHAGSAQLARQLVEQFQQQLEAFSASITQSVEAADYDALYDALHRLASASGTVFADAIHSHAHYLQNILKQKSLDYAAINDGVLQLLDEINHFEDYFEQLQRSEDA